MRWTRRDGPFSSSAAWPCIPQNLNADARASLFVAQSAADEDPLGAARVTLLGEVRRIPQNEVGEARERYLAKHPNSRYWVDFADFGFYRLEVLEVYYVGGFGVMGWVEAPDYDAAMPDPLAPSADAILAHMNGDHMDAMILLARTHAGIDATEAAMTAVDRLGFHLRLKTVEGMKGIRINFPGEVRTPQEARKALVEMVRLAKRTESPSHQ
jgi:heme iron utilization protein